MEMQNGRATSEKQMAVSHKNKYTLTYNAEIAPLGIYSKDVKTPAGFPSTRTPARKCLGIITHTGKTQNN